MRPGDYTLVTNSYTNDRNRRLSQSTYGNFDILSYAYDSHNNITSASDGTHTTTYAYDGKDQLLRENNQAAGKTWTYTYDDGGNILSKTEYAYTTGALGTPLDTIAYTYGDSTWGDLLTAYDGQTLTCDEIGNLAGDGTWTYTWQHARQLASMTDGTTSLSFYLLVPYTTGEGFYLYPYSPLHK